MSNNEMVSAPRELLAEAALTLRLAGGNDGLADDLRALLAAPTAEQVPVCIYWDAKTQDCMDSKCVECGGNGAYKPAAQGQGEQPRGSGSLEFDKLLAEYHAIIWASAEDGDCDYDVAGVDVAKKLQAMFLARGGQSQGEPPVPTAYLRESDLERLNKPGIAGCAASLEKEPRAGFVAIYTAQAYAIGAKL